MANFQVDQPHSPIRFLSDVHGPDRFLAPRVFPEMSRWLPQNRFQLENQTGAYICIAGSMPVLCHEGGATDIGLAMLRDAGVPTAECIIPYENEERYLAEAGRLISSGRKAVTVHLNPDRALPPGSMWIDKAIVAFLNNKARLADLAPANQVPRRRWIKAVDLARELSHSRDLPTVIKAATDQPSGGGGSVFVCRHRRDIGRAVKHFATADTLALEEFLSIRRNDCLHFAVRHDGEVFFVGWAEQICDRRGVHHGNRLDLNDPPQPQAVSLGWTIARRGRDCGYVGLMGLDIITTTNGSVFAIDLNFRPASSSAQVLFADDFQRARRKSISRLAFCLFDGPLDRAASLLRPLIEKSAVVPLATFEPPERAPVFLRLLALGNEKRDVETVLKELDRRGIRTGGWRPSSLFYRLTRRKC